MRAAEAKLMLLFTECITPSTADGSPACHGPWGSVCGKKGDALLVPTGFYTWAVPGKRRAGPGERGGGSYGRRTVATAKRAAMQISAAGKGLNSRFPSFCCGVPGCSVELYALPRGYHNAPRPPGTRGRRCAYAVKRTNPTLKMHRAPRICIKLPGVHAITHQSASVMCASTQVPVR